MVIPVVNVRVIVMRKKFFSITNQCLRCTHEINVLERGFFISKK